MSIQRVNRGSGHSYTIDGERADGVTTILSEGYPKPALINWAANATAGYAVDHWDELAAVTTSERLRTLERARFADRDGAAVRGTTIHDLAYKLQAGKEIDVPEPLLGHVDAYLRFTDEWQPQELIVETVIAHRTLRYCGTLDLVAGLNDGQVWLLDYKTSGKGVYVDTALQLAAYRNAEIFVDHLGAEQPMPKVDACGVVWLRADGYDLVPLDAGPAAWLAFMAARQVAQYRRNASVGEALEPPKVAA